MPGQKSRWIHEMSFNEVESYLRKDDVALVPVGATEQHGHHAPQMLDTCWAMASCEVAAELGNALIAPPVHTGWSFSHMDFPGSIGLRAETLTNVCIDICESLIYAGFKRIVLVNGNRTANNPPMDIAAIRLREETGALIPVADCGLIAADEIKALCEGGTGALGHAGESETSMILHVAPQFVDMKKAVDGTGANIKKAKKGGNRPHLHPGNMNVDPELRGNSYQMPVIAHELKALSAKTKGVRGAATLATPEKGKKMVEAIGRNIAALIEDLRARPVKIKRKRLPV